MPPVLDRLIARGAVPLNVPILQPAEPFLELAGEELRRRVFLAEDERGRTRCLRPELTIPAARAHIASGARGPVRYALAGTVFRQRGADGADEFPQAGIESVGDDVAMGDARALSDAINLVREWVPEARVRIGDRALHAAMLEAIVPPALAARLARLHGDAAATRALLDASEDRAAPETALGADPMPPPAVRAALEMGDVAALECAVADAIAASRMGKGLRGPAEIAARMIERHASTKALAPDRRATLDSWLALDCQLPDLAGEVERLMAHMSSNETGSDGASEALRAALDLHSARLAELEGTGLDPATVSFSAALGRSLDYYTGLVFEVTDAGGTVLAAGGRYDRLLALLGASEPEAAVGFALWLDRLGVALDGTPTGYGGGSAP